MTIYQHFEWIRSSIAQLTVSYPVKVYQNTSYGVEEAWKLVDIVIIPVSLSQIHLLAPLNQLCVHQIYVLRAHHLTRLKANKHRTQLENLKTRNRKK